MYKAANTPRPPRADARRNQLQILRCAAEVFVERGPNGPLEEIARCAGVGIGTLYRHFPDRQSLMDAVALDAITRIDEAATHCVAEFSDPFAGLVAYLHAALGLGVSAVIPVLLDRVDLDTPEIAKLRDHGVAMVQRLIDAAQAEGSLRPDVSFADIGVILVRLSRPLPG
ncbi:MAG: TetR/AcrR family transcriptional regulator, partial [Pseudonocardiaceae bacterium]